MWRPDLHAMRDCPRIRDVRERCMCPRHVRSGMGRLQREWCGWVRSRSVAADELRRVHDGLPGGGPGLRAERRGTRMRVGLPSRHAAPLRRELRLAADEHGALRRMRSALPRCSEGNEHVRRGPVHAHVQARLQCVQWAMHTCHRSGRVRPRLHDLPASSEQHPELHERRVHLHVRGWLGGLQPRTRRRLRDEHDDRSASLRRMRDSLRRHVHERPLPPGRRRLNQRRRSSGRAPCLASNQDVRRRRRRAEA
jgi:hypothetical protein